MGSREMNRSDHDAFEGVARFWKKDRPLTVDVILVRGRSWELPSHVSFQFLRLPTEKGMQKMVVNDIFQDTEFACHLLVLFSRILLRAKRYGSNENVTRWRQDAGNKFTWAV